MIALEESLFSIVGQFSSHIAGDDDDTKQSPGSCALRNTKLIVIL